MKRESFTIVIEAPKARLRYARLTSARPGKRKDDRKGNGKWRSND